MGFSGAEAGTILWSKKIPVCDISTDIYTHNMNVVIKYLGQRNVMKERYRTF